MASNTFPVDPRSRRFKAGAPKPVVVTPFPDTASSALLTEVEVSKQLRVSLAALRKWRVEKRGPQFLKLGSLVRYRQQDIDLWLSSLPMGGTQMQGVTGCAGS